MLGKSIFGLAHSVQRAIMPSTRHSHLAAFVTDVSKVEVREEKDHDPRDSELVIEVESAGVNPSDARMANGTYYIKPILPFVPGFEMAGNVKKIGKRVSKWKEGDRVVVIRSNGTGAFSEECVVHEHLDTIVPLAYSIDYETAAAISTSYSSAYIALQRLPRENTENSVLVISSRGTIAFAAIDLAQNVFKSTVLASSNNEENLDKLRSTGVQQTINYGNEKLVETVRKATNGKGVNLVVDTVGGLLFAQGLMCLRPGGSLVSLGFTSGEIPTLSLLDLHRTQANVSGVWLGGRDSDEVVKVLTSVLSLFEEKYLTARVEATYPLSGVQQCFHDIDANKIFGKVLINPKDSS